MSLSKCFVTGSEADGSGTHVSFENVMAEFVNCFFYSAACSNPCNDGNKMCKGETFASSSHVS